jgi:N-acyl homoserine lactone hydrolase
MRKSDQTKNIPQDRLLQGRPVSLHVLDYGTFRVHDDGRSIGLYGFLITTDADERVLVDTGMPAAYAEDPAAAGQKDGLDSFGVVVELTKAHLPAAQLERAGCDLGDVTLMVQTHSHIDHIGGLHLCPDAPMLIAKAERAQPKPLYWAGSQPMDWPDRAYIQLESDRQIGPGIDVLLVPGHTPGQLALLVDLPRTGSVLLTSDAISRPAEADDGFIGAHDVPAARQSADRLMRLANERHAFIIYGHCPTQRQELKKAPLAYT